MRFPVMILGVVVAIKDLGGRPGGETFARLAVAEHPAGRAPLVSRVRFWREPGGASPPYLEFLKGHRYVVIARRLADNSFAFDRPCGRTAEPGRETCRRLVRLASDR